MYRPKDHWGRYLWSFIHTICIIDFENNSEYVEKTFKNLKELTHAIPCPKCIHLYSDHLQKLETIDKAESMVLFKWSVELHNAVNRKMHKSEMSYEDALKTWTITI